MHLPTFIVQAHHATHLTSACHEWIDGSSRFASLSFCVARFTAPSSGPLKKKKKRFDTIYVQLIKPCSAKNKLLLRETKNKRLLREIKKRDKNKRLQQQQPLILATEYGQTTYGQNRLT
jgi:hypothetical protein